MTNQFSAPITDLLDLPASLKGVSSDLEAIFARVGINDLSTVISLPDFPPGDTSTAPPITEDEADAIQEWFEDEVEEPPPDLTIPQEIIPTVELDTGSRELTLRLKALSDIDIDLAGLDGVSFVINPGNFEATVTIDQSGVSVAFGLTLAARFKPNLLQPVRKVQRTNGQLRFEPDPTRPYTQIELGRIDVTVNTKGEIGFDSRISISLDDPVKLVSANLVIDSASLVLDLSGERNCLAFQWQESNLSAWFGQLAPNLREQGNQSPTKLTLQIILGDPIQEIRVDWEVIDNPRNYLLPGLKVTTPSNARFSLLLRSRDNSPQLNQLTLILTQGAAQTTTASSNFAWEREGDRELQNDDGRDAQAPPLFSFQLETQKDVSIVLLDMPLDTVKLPKFFRQLPAPIPRLDFADIDSLCQPINLDNSISLRTEDWRGAFSLNIGAGNQFTFPFLRQQQNGQVTQCIRIDAIGLKNIPVDFSKSLIEFPVAVTVCIGSFELQTEIDFKFNWETFALKVEHGDGLKLLSAEEDINPDKQYLGLTWRFKGAAAKNEDGSPQLNKAGEQLYNHLTLVTKDFNYQLIQPEGAVIELDYTLASDEPITFIVSNLAITDTGITLTAEVSDRPAKLNGLDTRFRFHGSRLEIVDNQIKDFTLAGSGPLPPDLVGDAIADIALQFSQQDGGLTLVSGGATLRGDKLLKCQSTRFEFAIDALGLKFVNDGKFHLYFTLSGSAQFLPLPTDDANGPLALLSGIKIQLVECPLTSDVSVIGQHVEFLIELPEKVAFSFLGCFEMEIRSIGFVPQFERFGGDGAMEIGGQLKFAQGAGDVNTVQIDFHSLFIGLPEKGSFIPRLYMQELEVNISLGEAFNLHGVVEFRDDPTEKGFLGEGMLEIPGMPVFAASFAFLRVRRSESEPWVRAWFIFLEARQISLYIPFVEFYIREVGLGFGYRYTIASIRAADEAADLSSLIGELRELSRTQGDLSKRDRWAVDLEAPGEDLRWTIVLRALISQTSATPGAISLKWLEHIEKTLACLFLFDAVVAFRSDLTFFMAVRAWLNTNYYDYVNDVDDLRERPLFSGFVLLSVRQKRFLAQISSNPNGSLGARPPLPTFVQQAVQNGQFAATILVEPALLHAELGWPNMLRWGQKIGPLDAEVSGGMIFRVSKHNLVLGISYKARGSLSFEAGLNLKIVGVRVSAHASFAWGARFIGVIDFANPVEKSALYAAIGLEIRIRVSIAIWIKLLFIKKTFRFSLEIGFTAGLELGVDGLTNPGLRGTGTLFISAMGRSFQVSVKLGLNEGAVQTALNRTAGFLNLGLEATDVDPAIPGVSAPAAASQRLASASPAQTAALSAPADTSSDAPIQGGDNDSAPLTAARSLAAPASGGLSMAALSATVAGFRQPNYDLFVIRPRQQGEWGYFVLYPRGETDDGGIEELGFLPVPPADIGAVANDFELQFPALSNDFTLQHFRPVADDSWQPVDRPQLTWKVDWEAPIEQATQYAEDGQVASPENSVSLGQYLAYAFKVDDQDVPVCDPDAIATGQSTLTDERVQNPSESAYEAAVQGALEQFRSSPFFKRDPNSLYGQALEVAFRDNTSIYTATGEGASGDSGNEDPTVLAEEQANQQAHQLRGMIVQDLIADLQDYAELEDRQSDDSMPTNPDFVKASIAFQMGLVFRFKGSLPDWLTDANPSASPTIAQRPDRLSSNVRQYAENETKPEVRTFNIESADYGSNPPQFEQVQVLTDTNTIAIAWDLTWRQPPENCSACQREPEHHLLHYQVRRRSLDGQEREEVYTLKPAEGVCFESNFVVTEPVIDTLKSAGIVSSTETPEALQTLLQQSFSGGDALIAAIQNALPTSAQALIQQNRQAILMVALESDGGMLKRLRPRFPLVDHFTAETLDDQAAMPATGRSYLYSITPIDFAKTPGRPLTLVATRYPSEPPRVPVDGEFAVTYQLTSEDIAIAGDPEHPTMPAIVTPQAISMRWSDPVALREGPRVPVAQYRLIFRKDITLPIGSYGLDSSTQGPRSKTLPTSNARPLPTDIKIRLKPPTDAQNRTTTQALVEAPGVVDPQEIPLLEALQRAEILPAGDNPVWRPEAWQIFFQTESINGVPSALAPVKLLLDFRTERGLEERQPAQLEWLPKPLRLALLPPEDGRIISGLAHVPMPSPTTAQFAEFDGTLDNLAYRLHPAQLRLLRLQWNQGPSSQPQYPLSLNAGYTLLELDVDANTTETFQDVARLTEALREIQQVKLLPADDLTLTPKDTLAASQWEAWYPSRVLRSRREQPPETVVEGSQLDLGPWYSWRESQLVWPDWPTLTDPTQREAALHPFLQALVETLDENLSGYVNSATNQPLQTYNVDLQFGPPRIPGDFAAFRDLTAPKADPYGWSILLRLGLSVGITLRDEANNELVTGDQLLGALQAALTALKGDPQFADWFPHLHVELLFQPGRSFSPEANSVGADSLLAMVQISLRPVVSQYLTYGMVEIQGPGRTELELLLTPFLDLDTNTLSPFTLIDQGDSALGQQELPPATQPKAAAIRQSVTLPLNGKTRLLLRYTQAPQVSLVPLTLTNPLDFTLTIPPAAAFMEQFGDRPFQQVLSDFYVYSEDPQPPTLELKPSLRALTNDQLEAFLDAFRLALDGNDQAIADLLLRYAQAPQVSFPLTSPLNFSPTIPPTAAFMQQFGGRTFEEALGDFYVYSSGDNQDPPTLELKPSLRALTNDQLKALQDMFRLALDANDQAIAELIIPAPQVFVPLTRPLNFSSTIPPTAAFTQQFGGRTFEEVLGDFYVYSNGDTTLRLTPPYLRALTNDQLESFQDAFRLSLDANDQAIADLIIVPLQPFSPLDERSTYFTVPTDLATQFADFDEVQNKAGTPLAQQWRQIKIYLESINSTDPSLPAISLPTSEAAIAELLPDFLTWTQRFFDASENVPASDKSGPWLATAYPRVSTPAYASPDANGRLKYDHLLTDRWAHNYRYYIRPSSRYDLLWQSLLQSPSLFAPGPDGAAEAVRELDTYVLSARSRSNLAGKLPEAILAAIATLENTSYLGQRQFLTAVETVAGTLSDAQKTTLLDAVETFREALPNPEAGGLDVTIDRTQPIDKPLILSSSRLDAASTPGQPAAPGRTWEVMVAQHPEQLLMERNQTLMRRLAYRQIAFTLMRRFAYSDWVEQLKTASDYDQLTLQPVQDQYPEIPSAYPVQPDHLDLTALSAADGRSLDLPLRNGNFQQGVLVLQWDALPFFYQHRLLLAAQSASTVSEPNEILQQDFEYFSPTPEAEVSSVEIDWQPQTGSAIRLRTRRVDAPLKRFWEALSTEVQTQWQSEEPDAKDSSIEARKPASLPDPEVIYQIVELFSGNVEVQAEYFFDAANADTNPQFIRRQLGQRFLGELDTVLPPPNHPASPGPQADFTLKTYLNQVHELQLVRSGYFTKTNDSYDIPVGESEAKVIRRNAPSLFLIGVFNRRDRTHFLLNSIPDLQPLSPFPGAGSSQDDIETFLDDWYATRAFSSTPIANAPDLTTPVSVDGEEITLPETVDYPEVPKTETIPALLRPKLTIRHDQVAWQGTILNDEKTALNTYRLQLPDYQTPVKDAINTVLDEIQRVVVTTPYDVPVLRPHPAAPLNLGAFTLRITVPSPPTEGNWTLGWTGPMSQAEQDALTVHAQGYEADYRDGVDALIQQVQNRSFNERADERRSSGSIPTAPPIPSSLRDKFSIDTTTTVVSGRFPPELDVVYNLLWQGSMTNDEATLLRQTFAASQRILTDAVDTLITTALEASNRLGSFTQTISFDWPRLDQLTSAQRTALVGNPLSGLTIDAANRRLRWGRADNLGVPADQLINQVQTALDQGDPFSSSFASLIQQLDRPYSGQVLLKLLRVRAILSEPEKTVLRQKFAGFESAINALFADLDDRAVIDQLYESGFSQEPISSGLATIPNDLSEIVDFPTPSETVLVWTGPVSSAERQAALNLSGDDAFTEALETITRLRPASADLPETVRNQLQITVNMDTGQEQLTWNFPVPTDEQIRILQDLTPDEEYQNSLRRLITAILNAPAMTEAVNEPLAPPPASQRRSIPRPEANSTRPATATLPAILQNKLLIGNAVIRYHGLMTVAEGQTLRSLYTAPGDRAAIERLFAASTQQGLNGRELRIRARRGSAAPTGLIALTPQSLPQD